MNKKLKVPLFLAVIIIWALIIFRIVENVGADSSSPSIVKNFPISTETVAQDTFQLLANYADPFFPESDSLVESKIDEMQIANEILPSPTSPIVVDLSYIKYLGMIFNPETKVRVAILKIRDGDYLSKEKESVEDFFIQKIYVDRIKLRYEKKVYEIMKERDF